VQLDFAKSGFFCYFGCLSKFCCLLIFVPAFRKTSSQGVRLKEQTISAFYKTPKLSIVLFKARFASIVLFFLLIELRVALLD
jgi:hypothetical protein